MEEILGDELIHKEGLAGPKKGNNQAAVRVSAPLCNKELPEHYKMTSSRLLVCMCLTKLS